ncbi:SDR family oxidoreductase [Pelomicrobium sp.]|jgi:3-oxoacyl-[acyl-carrier protein] reductase|uniref:SDR family oxidoreductase n=1 Tax=Pelomicrobium sp. TaxID=2815319 RepID=UPI002FDE9747
MLEQASGNPFRGKSVIVTGGSRGIGLATARAFLAAGARVALCARDPARLKNAEGELAGGERLLARVADVSDPAQVRAFVQEASHAFGALDVLVNNAGVLSVGPFAREPFERMGAVIDVNLKGVMYVTRALLPAMLERGEGVIVNVSSGAGLTGFAQIVSYCASKFGVVGFSAALDEEVRSAGVRVYALCPGRVATDMQIQYSGARVGMPAERVARRILALAASKPRRCVVTLE